MAYDVTITLKRRISDDQIDNFINDMGGSTDVPAAQKIETAKVLAKFMFQTELDSFKANDFEFIVEKNE